MKFSPTKIFLIFTFVFCIAAAVFAQPPIPTECARNVGSVKLPARETILAELRQVVRGEIERPENYRAAEKALFDFHKCLENTYSNSPTIYQKVKGKAKDDLIKYLIPAPDGTETATIMAQIELVSVGDFAAANQLANDAILIDGKNYEAYFVKAFINYKSTEGLENVEKAIRLNPDFAPAYGLKAEILLNLAGKSVDREEQKCFYEQAAKDIQKYLELAPNFVQASLLREQAEAIKARLAEINAATKIPSTETAIASKPTKPLKIISKPRADYSENARFSNVQGNVRVRVSFGDDGKIKYVLILQGLPFGLNQQTVAAAKQMIFEPAATDEKPIGTAKIIEYSFTTY